MTSKNLRINKTFLDLLLSTSTEQALALLDTATKDQLLLISEIAKNILRLPLPNRKAELYVAKRKKLFQTLANKSLSRARKIKTIRRNANHIMHVLLALKQQLSELL